MLDIVAYISTMQAVSTATGGRWVLSRPSSQILLSRRERLRDAWLVFTGRADAVQWHGKSKNKQKI